MRENRNDGDRLTDAQIDQVRELLAQEREALAHEREALLTAIDETVGKLLDKQYERIKAEVESSMKARMIELAALVQTVAELRSLITSEQAQVIESPPRRPN